ncbi:MAG: AprI/Inh family metalloprotease inhibitor [Alphaproteobacteria bacterium]|nr:AprI/Inh family metalloprotease inhibitor [Alphaproteobacteria bacterium]
MSGSRLSLGAIALAAGAALHPLALAEDMPAPATADPAATVQEAAPPMPAASDVIAALAGPWEYSTSQSHSVCAIILNAELLPLAPAGGDPRYSLQADGTCPGVDETASRYASWQAYSDDRLQFLDAQGQVAATFEQTDNGLYTSASGAVTRYLVNQDAADFADRAPLSEALAGDWTLSSDDDPTSPQCRLSLTEEALGDGRNKIALPDACPKWIEALALGAWNLREENIVLYSSAGGEIAQLAMEDPATWRGIAPNGQTLVLTLFFPGE